MDKSWFFECLDAWLLGCMGAWWQAYWIANLDAWMLGG
jgi:hypothetical protein